MIIANILKIIKLEEQQTCFNEKHIGGDDFPHLLQGKVGSKIRTSKWSALFLGTKRVSHSNEGNGAGATLGKFNNRDSNEWFCQMFTNVKIRKQKFQDLKNLKCCLELQKRISDVYKSLIKTSIRYYFYLTQQRAYFNYHLHAYMHFYLVALKFVPPNACVENY